MNKDRPEHHSTDGQKEIREEKEVTGVLSLKLETVCVQPDKQWYYFKGNLGETVERKTLVCMDLSELYNAILSRN